MPYLSLHLLFLDNAERKFEKSSTHSLFDEEVPAGSPVGSPVGTAKRPSSWSFSRGCGRLRFASGCDSRLGGGDVLNCPSAHVPRVTPASAHNIGSAENQDPQRDLAVAAEDRTPTSGHGVTRLHAGTNAEWPRARAAAEIVISGKPCTFDCLPRCSHCQLADNFESVLTRLTIPGSVSVRR